MRVFAGLPLPLEVKRKLSNIMDDFKQEWRGLNYPHPEGLHITLHFFGELTPAQVNQLVRGMEGLAFSPVSCSLSGLGQFPPRGNPRVIFAPLSRGGREVEEIFRIYEKSLEPFPFVEKETRPFKPHITIARNKRERVDWRRVEEYPLKEEKFLLDSLVLFQSRLTPRGAEYEALKEIRFK